MKILIVAATRAEIIPVIEHFNLADGELLRSDKFDILITGVGMTATAFALGKHLSTDYNLVLNLGIAGSFNHSLRLGTVINVTRDQFSEWGAENGDEFIPIDDMGFGKSEYESCSTIVSHGLSQLKKGDGITVNTVHGNQESIQKVIARLNPLIESMEGASVLYCCEKEGIPCLQIRSISNYVELRNRESWQIGLAIKNLNQWAISFLTNS